MMYMWCKNEGRLAILAAGLMLLLRAGSAIGADAWHGPGLAYYCDSDPRIPMAVHVVKIDRTQKDLELYTTLGGGKAIGISQLEGQVESIPASFGQPMAAINGDYFNVIPPYHGDPRNMQVLHGGELVSAPGEDRAFFYLDAKGQPHLTNVTAQFTVTWPDGRKIPFGLNETPKTGQAVIYTTAAGPNTRVEGIDLILARNKNEPWLPLKPGQNLSAVVSHVNRNGFTKTSPDTLVLSLSPRQVKDLPTLTTGMVLQISTATTPNLGEVKLAIGGGPSLVRGGKARPMDGIQVRHPRTAFGWNDKFYFFVQVDGRQARWSMGMNFKELADYFVKLGCTDALNLDGGGSATTWVAGRIINNPSQGRERATANALVVVRRNK